MNSEHDINSGKQLHRKATCHAHSRAAIEAGLPEATR
jgi:hypothetical protein